MLGIGVVAGWLASWIMGGTGLIRYVATGVIGSFVGGYLMTLLKLDLNLGNPLFTQIAVATLGAIIVIFVARMIG
jgi:uncharacterized membrane protein YeaQ/YmgE (transglycosylase-associated protein family)